MLAAILVTGIVQGRPGLRDLGSRMVRWRVPARWYATATALARRPRLTVAAAGRA
jgi:hypothetical protein